MLSLCPELNKLPSPLNFSISVLALSSFSCRPARACPTSMSGEMPELAQITNNVLKVLKVDDSVNTTFVCEVSNRIGTGRDQVTVVVRGEFHLSNHQTLQQVNTKAYNYMCARIAMCINSSQDVGQMAFKNTLKSVSIKTECA